MSGSETMDGSLWCHLPPEIIAHILSLLPVKSLCRFKCVSPSWKSLISSPNFSKTHLHMTITTNKPQKTLLRSRSDALYSLDLADANPTADKLDSFSAERFGEWRMVSNPCNGLLLVQGRSLESNFLVNPFTSECKKLPEPPFSDVNSSEGFMRSVRGLGYDSRADDYKVLIVRSPLKVDIEVDTDVSDVAVYSLKTDAWRGIQVSHDMSQEGHFGVYLNDRLHWVCPVSGRHASAFDLLDETFRKIELPDYVFDDSYMDVIRGCLCLVIFIDYGIDVWMMNEYGVTESWTKSSIANPRMYIDGVLCWSADDEFVLSTRRRMVDFNGEIIGGEPNRHQLILYNPKKEIVRVMIVPGIPTIFYFLGNSVETLISPNWRTDYETM